MKADITTVVNGGITNSNIAATAAIVESKVLFSTSGHDHDGVTSSLVAGGNILRADITGCKPVYVSVDTLYAESGALEINGVVFTRNSKSTTINLGTAGHWVGGVSSRAVSTTFYIYAYNDSGTTWDIKFWSSAPQYANCGTDTEGTLFFRQAAGVWYRCIGTATTNATGAGELSSGSIAAWPTVVNATVDVYTSTDTWIKPAGCTIVKVVCVGGGAGGGAGLNASSGASGGGGGGGGAVARRIFRAADLSDTVAVTVPNAAASGAAGGTVTFGAYLSAYGGGAGCVGTAGATNAGGGGGGTGGVGAVGTGASSIGGAPSVTAGLDGSGGQGAGGVNGDNGKCAEYGGGAGGGSIRTIVANKKGGSSIYGAGGGGPGGGWNGAHTFFQPGEGGKHGSFTVGGGGAAGVSQEGGGTAGTAGTAGDGILTLGYGGGGGGAGHSTGAVGGAGGAWGGGGGGGGNSEDGTPGAGGAGGKGGCVVYSW